MTAIGPTTPSTGCENGKCIWINLVGFYKGIADIYCSDISVTDRFLESYTAGTITAEQFMEQIEALVGDNPDALTALRDIKAEAHKLLAEERREAKD